ncbi:MAG: LLM class flavin-dependent oxidoreductase [Chromatiales bacterium]|nr:LLM class flavin-dependent oxidoreductase [Chromatiales bacterium]
MDIDLILEPDLTPAQIAELGVLAEQYPFRAIWIENYVRARDPFLSAVPLALATSRLKVGIVVVSGYEMHPLKMANALLTLNEYCHGRAMLTVGGGGEWPGVMQVGYGRRIQGFREAADIVTAAVSGKVVNYPGQVYKSRGYVAHWHRERPPLVYGGATGPRMLRAAAHACDGTMLSDIALPMLDKPLATIRDALAAEGRDPAAFRISNFVAWHVKEDRAASLREARRELMLRGWLEREWLEPLLSRDDVEFVMAHKQAFLQAFRDRSGDIKGVPDPVVDALVEGLSCAGDLRDLDRHTERLREFARHGLTEVALRIHDDPADSIRMLGERVLPRLG